MKKRIVVCFVILVSIGWSASDALDYVAAKGKMESQFAGEYLQCVELAGKNAKLSLPIVEELRQLVEGLPDDKNKSTGELMNTEQADKFGRLAQKQQFFSVKNLFISKRQRDIEFVEDVFDVIIAEFEKVNVNKKRDRNEEQKKLINSFAELLGGLVIESRDKVNNIEMVNDGIDGAFREMIRCAGDIMESRGDKLEKYQAAFENRNGKKLKIDEISQGEKDVYEKIRGPAVLAFNANVRLMGLRILYSLMTMENKWAIEEFSASGGDLDSAGVRMKEFSGKSSEEIQLMVGLVRLINDKIPCGWVQDMDIMEKAKNDANRK